MPFATPQTGSRDLTSPCICFQATAGAGEAGEYKFDIRVGTSAAGLALAAGEISVTVLRNVAEVGQFLLNGGAETFDKAYNYVCAEVLTLALPVAVGDEIFVYVSSNNADDDEVAVTVTPILQRVDVGQWKGEEVAASDDGVIPAFTSLDANAVQAAAAAALAAYNTTGVAKEATAQAIHGKTTNLPASPAAVGSAMALTESAQQHVANAVHGRRTWYVDAAVGASGDGTTWETAFKTVAEGVAVLSHFDALCIKGGDYNETLTVSSKLGLSIIGIGNPRIYHASADWVVTFHECSGLLLSGLTVEHTGTPSGSYQFTALLQTGTTTTFTIRDCRVISKDMALSTHVSQFGLIDHCYVQGSEYGIIAVGATLIKDCKVVLDDWSFCDNAALTLASVATDEDNAIRVVNTEIIANSLTERLGHRTIGIDIASGLVTLQNVSCYARTTEQCLAVIGVRLRQSIGWTVVQKTELYMLDSVVRASSDNGSTPLYDIYESISTGAFGKGIDKIQTLNSIYDLATCTGDDDGTPIESSVEQIKEPATVAAGDGVDAAAVKAAVEHADYGLAKLVRSATPAHALAVSAEGAVDACVTLSEQDIADIAAGAQGLINSTLTITSTGSQPDYPVGEHTVLGTWNGYPCYHYGTAWFIFYLTTAECEGVGDPGWYVGPKHPADPAFSNEECWRHIDHETTPVGAYLEPVEGEFDSITVTGDYPPRGMGIETATAAADAKSASESNKALLDARLDAAVSSRATPAQVAAALSGGGSQAKTICITTSAGSPLDGVEVNVYSDAACQTKVAGPKYTNALGIVSFDLDPGTYYVRRQRGGYNFTNPQSIVVS